MGNQVKYVRPSIYNLNTMVLLSEFEIINGYYSNIEFWFYNYDWLSIDWLLIINGTNYTGISYGLLS